MRFYRNLLVAALAAGLALAAGARAQESSKAAQAPPSPKAPPPPKADAKATKVLDDAIKKLDPAKLGWVETSLWQRFDLQGLKVQSEGRYLAGPDYHLHVRLKVNLAGAVGSLESVCDGTTLWRVWDVPPPPDKEGAGRQVQKVDWKKVMDTLNRGGMPRQVREMVLQRESFAGPAALLEALRKGMTITGQTKARWNGRDVTKLSAVWSPETIKPTGLGNPPWPHVPHRCEIYLDRDTGWPYRLEAWGAVRPRAEDGLLVQMEFRDPTFHKKLSPGRIAREFTFRPGTDDVADKTDETVDGLKRLAEQKPRQKK